MHGHISYMLWIFIYIYTHIYIYLYIFMYEKHFIGCNDDIINLTMHAQ